MRNTCKSHKLAAASSIVTSWLHAWSHRDPITVAALHGRDHHSKYVTAKPVEAGEVLGDEFDVEEELEATQAGGLIEMNQPTSPQLIRQCLKSQPSPKINLKSLA